MGGRIPEICPPLMSTSEDLVDGDTAGNRSHRILENPTATASESYRTYHRASLKTARVPAYQHVLMQRLRGPQASHTGV